MYYIKYHINNDTGHVYKMRPFENRAAATHLFDCMITLPCESFTHVALYHKGNGGRERLAYYKTGSAHDNL